MSQNSTSRSVSRQVSTRIPDTENNESKHTSSNSSGQNFNLSQKPASGSHHPASLKTHHRHSLFLSAEDTVKNEFKASIRRRSLFLNSSQIGYIPTFASGNVNAPSYIPIRKHPSLIEEEFDAEPHLIKSNNHTVHEKVHSSVVIRKTPTIINSKKDRLKIDVHSKKNTLITSETPQKPLAANITTGANADANVKPVNSKKGKEIKYDKISNHIIEQYGRLTEASSINKLDTNQMSFLKQTKYISFLRSMFPKLSINLNENMKNLYFFGAKEQVISAKLKINSDLSAFKKTEYALETNELAEFLQRPEVRKKILKFINHQMAKHENESKKSNVVFKVCYCNFDISNSSRTNKENKDESFLNIFTNLTGFDNVLVNFIHDEIIVNYKIEIPNRHAVLESISKQDQNWTSIYLKYNKYLDICLEAHKEKANILKEIKPKLKPNKWFIKLTGFKEEMEQFKLEFKNKYFESRNELLLKSL